MCYCRIFSLLGPARGYTLHIKSVAETRIVKLVSLEARRIIYVGNDVREELCSY
jgi:hypothetical protein